MKNSLLRRIVVPAAFFLGGLAVSLVMLEVSLRVVAYLYVRSTTAPVPAARKDGSRVTVGCFGDSFTEGGYSLFKDRYPAQLQRIFDAAGEKVDVINYGVCEFNSTQVYRRLKRVTEKRHLDYVVLLVGSANRFNLVGFDDSPLTYFVKRLRVYRLAHVFGIYVRDRLLRLRASHSEFTFDMESREPTDEDVRQMVLKDPRNGYMRWARHYISQARFSDALNVLKQAVADGNRDPNIQIAMGECYEGLGDYPSAERVFRASLASFPEQGYISLGNYYARQGNYTTAERLLREAIRYNASEGNMALGLFYFDQKKYAQAEDAFKHAHAFNPIDADRNLINLYAESGRYAEAEAKYEEALDLYPDQKFLAKFAVIYYIPRGKYADAVRCFLKALDAKRVPDMSPFFLMNSVFFLQSQYSGQDVFAAMERAEARHPFLAKDRTFQAYKECFRDYGGWERRQGQWLSSDLESIAALCREKGITLIVMNYPVPFPLANGLLASLAERHHLPFIDICSQFAVLFAREGKAKYLQKDQNHCTPEGYHLMADNIFRTIKSLRTAQRKGS